MPVSSCKVQAVDSIDLMDQSDLVREKDHISPLDSSDYFSMVMGTIGSIGSGASSAIFCIIFGMILDILNSHSSQSEIDELLGYLVITGFGTLLSGWFLKVWWTLAGEEQMLNFKKKRFRFIISRDIIWYVSTIREH